jgi:hypothetical protein
MSEFLNMQERIERFNLITAQAKKVDDHGLLQTFPLSQLNHTRLLFALNYYLYVNLTEWYSNQEFHFSGNMLEDYGNEILKLPNVTPNGLILPKVENCIAYNFLHREFALAFDRIGMSDEVESIQFPINIRVKQGLPNPVVDERPLSSTKPHTDIWAGDPAAAMLVFLSLLGDPEKAGLQFMHVPEFPKKFSGPLKDYDSGKEVVDLAQKIPAQLSNGKWFMIDSYLLHQTIKNGAGLRISIDIRFMPKRLVSSDTMGSAERLQFFSSYDKWSKIGSHYWVTTDERMGDKPKSTYDFTIIDYPRNIASHIDAIA